MIFNGKKTEKSAATTRQKGAAAENAALEYLQAAGLALVERNFKTPGRGGGEIDLIMRDAGGTLIFVEVRARRSAAAGGAAASDEICAAIARRVGFVAPVKRYPGEHELASLAENGYNILSGKVQVHHYDKNGASC